MSAGSGWDVALPSAGIGTRACGRSSAAPRVVRAQASSHCLRCCADHRLEFGFELLIPATRLRPLSPLGAHATGTCVSPCTATSPATALALRAGASPGTFGAAFTRFERPDVARGEEGVYDSPHGLRPRDLAAGDQRAERDGHAPVWVAAVRGHLACRRAHEGSHRGEHHRLALVRLAVRLVRRRRGARGRGRRRAPRSEPRRAKSPRAPRGKRDPPCVRRLSQRVEVAPSPRQPSVHASSAMSRSLSRRPMTAGGGRRVPTAPRSLAGGHRPGTGNAAARLREGTPRPATARRRNLTGRLWIWAELLRGRSSPRSTDALRTRAHTRERHEALDAARRGFPCSSRPPLHGPPRARRFCSRWRRDDPATRTRRRQACERS